MTYGLTPGEREKLGRAILAALSIPFIDDIEDYIWEAVFSYVKDVVVPDPLTHIRSKKLFDVVDKGSRKGWSAKALQWSLGTEVEFELVIQRADVLKKRKELGFPELRVDSDPGELGAAVVKHWNEKVVADSVEQGVDDRRVAVLLKSRDRRTYAYYEADIETYDAGQLDWAWTSAERNGLQGRRRDDGFLVYRWYPNQKQLFERFKLPAETYQFNLNPRRLEISELIESVLHAMNGS